MKTLKELLISDLADIYDAELQIAEALPRMAMEATDEKLIEAFRFHLQETQWRAARVEHVFECFEESATRKTCKATVGLLEEGEDVAMEFAGTPAINAALIATAQKVEHYEMASFGCLHEWAEMLENPVAAGILQEILWDVKAADSRFSDLALSRSNEEALAHVIALPRRW